MTAGPVRRVAVTAARGLGALVALGLSWVLWEAFGDTSDGVDRCIIAGLIVVLAGTTLLLLAPGDWAGRWGVVHSVGVALLAIPVVLFLAFLLIGGLVAPDLVADPDANRAPSTPTEARVLSGSMLSFGAVVALLLWFERRRSRKR